MIDIHAHILPQVDDGPANWDESLALLQSASDDGVEGVVCTSHVIDRLDEDVERLFLQRFRELQKRARDTGLGMKLWLGAEIHCYTQFDVRSPIATLNGNGKYLLLEFPLGDLPADDLGLLSRIVDQGVCPILAHPERNDALLHNPQRALEYIQRGVLLQLNAGSLLGSFGRKVASTARLMLEHRMIHFVASDGHSVRGRPVVLSRAFENVAANFGGELAERLFRTNPQRAVEGKTIDFLPPLPFEEKQQRRRKFRFTFFRG